MSAFATIFLIFLAQCTYLHATPLADKTNCLWSSNMVSMILFTRKYPTGKNIGVEECCKNIDKSKPIAFLIHGFTSDGNTTEAYKVADELVTHDYTVFSVDWSEGACTHVSFPMKFLLYDLAAINTRMVGSFSARYIKVMVEECGVSLDQIRCLGHSLGGHVCGFLGKKIQEMGVGTLPRIVAMDPAAPNFNGKTCKDRLCKNDTKHLVVLHTSSYGLRYSIGHLDLYFNNQNQQPGCGWFEDIISVCSHTMAVRYVGSLMRDNCGFIAVPQKTRADPVTYPGPNDKNCIFLDSKVLDTNDTKKGNYFVFPGEYAPFCTNKALSCQR